MKMVMGPVLGFRGRETADRWRVCALMVTTGSGAPGVAWSVGGVTNTAAAVVLKTVGSVTAWCAEWVVQMTAAPQVVDYQVGAERYSFEVPGTAAPAPGQSSVRFAYTSCNGFSHPRYMKNVEDKNALWRQLREQHEEEPYHLLLMGGDQVYADSIWEVVGSIKRWSELSRKDRRSRSFTKEMAGQVERFYFQLYCERWSQPEMQAMLARVPTVMMWDDHDIFDGWGSYPREDHECEVYQGIFRNAREMFCVFQLKTAPFDPAHDAHPPWMLQSGNGYNALLDTGEVAIAVLDLRNERTLETVMGKESLQAAINAIDSLTGQDAKRHLLVMSSIPMVYLDLSVVERILALTPGRQELEDDLQDHWRSRMHRIERLRLFHRLLDHAAQTHCRVTVLSGDVHVGALGIVQSQRHRDADDHAPVINQLISSGIVHPPPPAIVVFAFEQIADRVEEVDRGIEARLLELPGTNKRLIGKRNCLSLSVDDRQRIWAEWLTGPESERYSKVIHPC